MSILIRATETSISAFMLGTRSLHSNLHAGYEVHTMVTMSSGILHHVVQ
jgi:hypothetical protein